MAVWCFCTALFSAGPSNAFSLFDQSFSGLVTSAIETAPSGPPKTDALMIGEPFTASVSIQQIGASVTGTAVLDVNVLGTFFLFTGPYFPNQSLTGATYSGNATFDGSSGTLPGFTFTLPGGDPFRGILTAQFSIAGINVADDTGSLNLTLSAVPLPPAFSMFASGLLALGLFGFAVRKKSATKRFATG
jgi:hypothetical protein